MFASIWSFIEGLWNILTPNIDNVVDGRDLTRVWSVAWTFLTAGFDHINFNALLSALAGIVGIEI